MCSKSFNGSNVYFRLQNLKKKKAVKRGKVTLQELFEANDRVMRLKNGNNI